jgi:DNA repair protein RadC
MIAMLMALRRMSLNEGSASAARSPASRARAVASRGGVSGRVRFSAAVAEIRTSPVGAACIFADLILAGDLLSCSRVNDESREQKPVRDALPIDLDERPRERLVAHGPERLAADELIALVLGAGTSGRPATAVAREILARVGGIAGLAKATPSELCAAPAVGAARAARLVAAIHLGVRVAGARTIREAVIRGPEDVYRRLRPRYAGLVQEVFTVLALDARGAIIEEIEVARGCLTGVEVHPREVFRPLIRAAAASAVAAHNHPSGDPSPSGDDIALTRRLRAVGEVVGIPLVDHVVIGDDDYTSLAEVIG